MVLKSGYLVAGFALVIYVAFVWFADPILLFPASVFFGLLGLFAALIAIAALLIAIYTKSSRRTASGMLAIVAGVGFFGAAAWPLNAWAQEFAVADAKAYPEHVAPLLEAHRKANGKYPTSLDQLAGKPTVPRLLRRSPNCYYSDGRSYSFSFPQPGAMMDTWDYNSSSKEWAISD